MCALAAAGRAAAATVRSAHIAVSVPSHGRCDVTMTLAVTGATEIEHRLETVEGGRVELASVKGAEPIGQLRQVGRTLSLIVRASAEPYEITYRLDLLAPARDRCALWLPTLPTTGAPASVTIDAELPPAAIPGETMPAFAWDGHRGRASLAHLPAALRLPFGDPGTRPGWGLARVMDALAIAVFAGASGIWAMRARR
jgi:hypothetical protein